jgi:cytochrome c biogenesis protein CcmG, thiol:disulfide interchange protein DsbE
VITQGSAPTRSREIGGARRARHTVAVALLVAVACGGSAAGRSPTPTSRSAPADGEWRPAGPVADAVSASCPTDPGTPIAGLHATVLPCLTDPGRAVSVAAVHGRPEVINLWASWCDPCRREAPLLEAAHQAAGERVLFLGVDSREDRTRALRFLAASRVTYPQVFDASAAFARQLGVLGLPYTLVVDASGRVVYRHIGELTPQALREGLARIGWP